MHTFITMVVLVFLLLALLPASHMVMDQYNLTGIQYRILLFIVYLPFALIWFTALYGATKLESYTASIRGSQEHRGFMNIARGCQLLAWGLLIQTTVSLILSAIANQYLNFYPTAMILTNYVSLIFPLVAFYYISEGGKDLSLQTKEQVSLAAARNFQLVFAGLGAAYCYLIFRNLDLHTLAASTNAYFLPVWLLVLTVIIPYLYAWFIGLLGAYEIRAVARQSKGILYRQALRYVSGGVSVVVAGLIAGQYVHSAIPRAGGLSLNITLLIIYIIYIIVAVGFILIAMGANRLKKIEEV